MNEITLMPIGCLWDKGFFIPSYQRGYRWTKQQVEDLLDDILEFTKKEKTKNEFYCLQPLVVRKHKLERQGKIIEDGWEVIDGQQRLTTIRIILECIREKYLDRKSYKNDYSKEVFHLEYETRPETEKLMKDITKEGRDYIDDHFIKKAYDTILLWFEKKILEGKKPISIYQPILKALALTWDDHIATENASTGIVQVIWYEIQDEKDPIETFRRINMDKIPLTNSELIKALFLREQNFCKDSEDNKSDLLELRQLQIATDWDRIENSLQNDEFWWFLNKDKDDIPPARIEFIFELMKDIALKNDPSLTEIIGNDKDATFRYFNHRLSSKKNDYVTVKTLWDEVKDYFYCFEDWFNNYEWYHYIGFLVYCGRKILDIYLACKDGIHDKEAKIFVKTREDVTRVLQELVRRHFKNVKWTSDKNGPYINLSYDKDKKTIWDLLFLYNIECIVAQCKNGRFIYKFPFKAFKENGKEHWDVEHIDSYTQNGLKDKDPQGKWLESSNHVIDMFKKLRESYKLEFDDLKRLQKRIKEYKDTEQKDDEVFEALHSDIQKIFQEDENNEDIKNNIGNLTLLDSHTNRSYGNALFWAKREIIIKNDQNGLFIPIGTKNVFLKYFDKDGISLTSWSQADIEKYRANIADTLKKFLPSNEEN
ncbi:MAG: DUF262 domain-containing HNH endonuclease family protein [Prevotellaceae bacterium]|jgi:uncharacterized protein with ParB-like and HNH nuclease domain|nr:DUF262 domain-containing HNH endonuclease family protein [Prevotellaceae bacterium]